MLNIKDPLVAWLTYRGVMASASTVDEHALSFWSSRLWRSVSHSSAHSAGFVEREIQFEQFRRDGFPDTVSRLSGFFAFRDLATARSATRSWGPDFSPLFIEEISIMAGARVSRHDSNWVQRIQESPEPGFFRAYWAGEPADDEPLWELLVEGRAYIFGTWLRERAKAVVDAAWPGSRRLLEEARLGAVAGLDAGQIVAYPVQRHNAIEVSYLLVDVPADFEQTLIQLHQEGHPIDIAALRDEQTTVPDLRSRSFSISVDGT